MAFSDAFKTFPILTTQRLILRQLTPEDAEIHHQQQASALAIPNRPYWGFGGETESVEKARLWIGFANSAWKRKARLKWGICLQATGALVGACELFDFTNQSKAEVGYWLGACYHRQGIMTEALEAVVAYAFETMQLHRIYAYTSTSNTPSLALLEKVGFVREGVLRQHTNRDGRWDDSIIAAILKDDYLSTK